MSHTRNARRDFLRQLACLAASGSAAALVPQLRMMGTALAAASTPGTLSGYCALVCIYLAGGNDSWNLLLPYDQARYDVYAASRGGVYNAASNAAGLALDRATLLTLSGAGGSGSGNYALHPSVPELRSLYDAQKLAFLVNLGSLVQPISKADYNASAALRPPQLFSHSDQENLWHVGAARDARYGWGGQAAAVLRPQFPAGNSTVLSPCISIAGANKFETGNGVLAYQLSSGGLSGLSGVCNPSGCTGLAGQRDVALNQLLADSYAGNLMADEYRKTFQRGRDLYALLAGGLAGADGSIATAFPTQNSLADQLKMVARMIKLSRAQGYAARQIYYVRYGGFDLHDGLMGAGNSGHAALLGNVSKAVSAFWTALGEIGAQNEVTAFSMSEFARTLSSNGNGSDHGWGGVQFVLGGGVVGGRLYADGGGPISGFPDQSLNGPVTLSRGQCIPGIGIDQYGATLARWLGITADTDLAAIFPNLANFNPAFRNLGFLA